MLKLYALAILSLTLSSCAPSAGMSGSPRSTLAPRLSPAELPTPYACTEQLPTLPTWGAAPDPDSRAVSIRLRGELSDVRAEWVSPFRGILISDELRAREAQHRAAQAARVRLALRLRDLACRQWAGRADVLGRDQRRVEVEMADLREQIRVARWLLVGGAGVLGLVALVAVASSGG